MNDPHRPNQQRPSPEMGSDRDALNLVRKRRGSSPGGSGGGRFSLTMPVKIGAIALVFSGIVLSVWTMKSAHTPVSDDDLPVLAADLDMDDFKVAPGEADEVPAPHSDKEFYSELDSSKATSDKGAFRKAPEQPSKQVSQEALFAEAQKEGTPEEVVKVVVAPKTSSKEVAIVTAEPVVVEEIAVDDVDVGIIESANSAAKQAYKAPASTTSVTKPRKTLEMAIQETKNKILKEAKVHERNKALSKNDFKKETVKNAPIKTAEKKVAPKKVAPLKIASKKTAPKKMLPVIVKALAPKVISKMYWVQVASLSTQEAAQKEGARVKKASAKELTAQKYRAMRVDLGKPKGIHYRVQFGPFSREAAIQKCKNLKGREGTGCFVVKG